ncbi:MAG: hypothetical protein HY079_13525, partial [Elusimicrobia bacterium]|nr:hypothetical protein [Elusimicrobiota bacterium]
HMWDANSLPTTAVEAYGPATEAQMKHRSADGSYFDDQDPSMAKAGARFNQLREPAGPPDPHFDKMDPNPFVVSEKLQKRAVGPDGKPVIKEAGILNDWAAGHIQFNVHDWENHARQPITQDPIRIPLPEGHPMTADGSKEAVLDRTELDPNLPKDYQGPAVHRNMETSGWDMSMVYGSSLERQLQVRTMKDGKLKIGADGKLLDDPEKPGVPLTGFNDNMTPQLAMLHTVWTLEHNRVADMVKAEHPDWDDEAVFQMARLRVTALNARLHTTEWTRALLPHPTLQDGMWADWYGFVGKRLKLWIMRFSDRHPALGKLLGKLVRYELLFGVPGTPTQHYGKRYGFVEEFPDVYRLHSMIRDLYQIKRLQPNADGTVEVRLLKELALEDANGYKTTGVLKEFSGEDLALSYGLESSGALAINNTPNLLRNLTTQDGRKIDLAAVDTIRTRERLEASTYVKFTTRLGERPPRTFEELTGGDREAADKLRAVYGSVDKVDFSIGILAERKPDAFALGNRQFKVFVLSAPARLKNDRFLSEQYGAGTYGAAGIEYIEHTNFANVLARAYPGLRAADVEALPNAFAPWAAPGTLPARMIAAAEASDKKADDAGLILSFVATAAILATPFVSAPLWWTAGLAAAPLALTYSLYRRARARWSAAEVARAAAGSVPSARPALTARVEEAAADARSARLWAKLGAFTVLDLAGMVAWSLSALHPVAAVALGATALVLGLSFLKKAKAFDADLAVLRVGTLASLRRGAAKVDPATLPGDTALAKRYWFLLEGKDTPVATFSDSYAALKRGGLAAPKAFVTAALSHLSFSAKSQKSMTAEQKARFKPGRFDLFVPGLIDAAGYGNTRVYAETGPERGNVDRAEFERLFRDFGGRDYLTAYDLARVREANQWRDAVEGRGTRLQRLIGRFAAKRRADQLMELFADHVVWEDEQVGRLVPAIGKERLWSFYTGAAQRELLDERAAAGGK